MVVSLLKERFRKMKIFSSRMMPRSQASTYPRARSANPSIPEALNLSLAGLHIFLNLFQLFILPLYLLPKSLWWSVFLIPIACLNNPSWALVHEAIHDSFNSFTRINLVFGRWLAIFFGAPFHVLRLTHLSHHKFNRSPMEKGTEIYDPGQVSRIRAGLSYFFYIFCGLYLLEVSSTFIFFSPPKVFRKMRQRLLHRGSIQEKWLAQKLMDEKVVRHIRIDGMAIVFLFALSAFCFGEHWKLLLGLLAVRTFLISFMDNVYHYQTPLHATVSGHNFSLPRGFSRFLLNFNLHRVHHSNPNVSWVKLPDLFAQQRETFDGGLLAAAVDQLRGPIALSDFAALTARQKT
jgi:fatty acid desaturase